MSTINAKVSTNTDPSLDALMLTQGHPMVPFLGVVDLCYTPSGTWMDFSAQALTLLGEFKIMHAGFYGVYGPAWAAKMDVVATQGNNGNSISLKVTNDALKAGIEWGASHSFNFQFVGKSWQFDHWDYIVPIYAWHETDNISVVIPLDFIQLASYAIKLIQWLATPTPTPPKVKPTDAEEIEMSDLRQTVAKAPANDISAGTLDKLSKPPTPSFSEIAKEEILKPTIYGLTDEAKDTFNRTGMVAEYVFPVGVTNLHCGDYLQMKAYPGLVDKIDIYQILVALDKNAAAFSGALYGFNELINKFWCSVSFGMNVGVIFPFTLSLKHILYENAVYGNLTYEVANQLVTGTKLTPAPTLSMINSTEANKGIDLHFDFSTGFDFRFGLFVEVTLLKVLTLSASMNWNVFEDWFGLTPHLDDSGVKIGGNAAAAAQAKRPVDEIEVVFA